jgi:hypothetical protein
LFTPVIDSSSYTVTVIKVSIGGRDPIPVSLFSIGGDVLFPCGLRSRFYLQGKELELSELFDVEVGVYRYIDKI